MTHAPRLGSSAVHRWGVAPGLWALFVLAAWVLVTVALSGCAGTAASATSTTREPVTESDEPELRKRARIRLELAAGYFENGQTSVALDEIKQSLAADPSYGPAYVLRGLVYMRLNDNALAEDSFQRALRINPQDADALHNFGWFNCQLGRHAEAVELFRRALAVPLYGGQAKTFMTQGICQTRMGRLGEAESSFARSYEIDAANPVTAYNLASLLYRRGEYTRAQFYIRRLNNSDLANAETLWLGIKGERRMNNTEAQTQLAQQLARRYPASAEWKAYQRGAFDE